MKIMHVFLIIIGVIIGKLVIVELLQKSGAKCLKYHMKKGNHSGFGMYCNYYKDFISLAPLTHYEIWLDANEKSKIIDIEVAAFSGIGVLL